MKRSAILLLAFSLLALAAVTQSFGQKSDREVRNTVRSLNNEFDSFRYTIEDHLSRVRLRQYNGEDINKSLDDLEDSVIKFQERLRNRQETGDDVSDIVKEARDINDFLNANPLGDRVQDDWSGVKTLIEKLASHYGVQAYWDNNSYPQGGSTNSGEYGLTGTYRLNNTRSDNTADIVDREVSRINSRDRELARRDLMEKLDAANTLAIDVRGKQVTLASDKGPQVNFIADGSDRFENLPNGKSVRVRATVKDESLSVSTTGDRENDFNVKFELTDNGDGISVTKRVTNEYLRRTVLVQSYYERISDVAQLNIYDGGGYPSNQPTNKDEEFPTIKTGGRGEFIVANGTILTAFLDSDISTKASQENDRFRMTVQAPNEYKGAVIEGYLTGIKRSGRINSRAQVTFNFERIRLTNGQVYDFAGFVQSITNEKGETVKTDTEGSAKGDSQTKETVKRSGIGAGIGAIIGAIAGGPKGAIIGATIGAGAGAGSVIVQGKDDLELKTGSSLQIMASAPSRR